MSTDEREWMRRAACAGLGPLVADAVFFPVSRRYTRAAAWCERCPVLAECRADVLAYERAHPSKHRHGFVGGLKPDERVKILQGERSVGEVAA